MNFQFLQVIVLFTDILLSFLCNDSILPDDCEIVPIGRVANSSGVHNFPLIQCNSLTIHKSQGSTYECDVYLNIGTREDMGSTFVALTRVKMMEQLFVLPFDFERFKKICEGQYIDERRIALETVKDMEHEFV